MTNSNLTEQQRQALQNAWRTIWETTAGWHDEQVRRGSVPQRRGGKVAMTEYVQRRAIASLEGFAGAKTDLSSTFMKDFVEYADAVKARTGRE